MKRILLALALTLTVSLSGTQTIIDANGHHHHVRPHHFFKDSRFYWGLGIGTVMSLAGVAVAIYYLNKRFGKQESEAWYGFKFAEAIFSSNPHKK
jgi:hypothetical protein